MRTLILLVLAPVAQPLEGQWRKFRAATGSMVQLQKDGLKLHKELQNAPETVDFIKYSRMVSADKDRQKLTQIAIFTIYNRWYVPLGLWCFPQFLPTAYQSTATKRKFELKYRADQFENRRKIVFAALAEDEKLDHIADKALSASSKTKALNEIINAAKPYRDDDFAIKHIPKPMFYAASRAVEGPWGIFPKYFHCRAIRKGMRDLADADEVMRRTNLNTVPEDLLHDACLDRSLGVRSKRDMVNGLNEWLDLTKKFDSKDGKHSPPSNQARLALLTLNTASRCRDQLHATSRF